MLPNAAKMIADLPQELHCAVNIGGVSYPAALCAITGANGARDATEHGRSDGISEMLYIPAVAQIPDNGRADILRYGAAIEDALRITGSRKTANLFWALTVEALHG